MGFFLPMGIKAGPKLAKGANAVKLAKELGINPVQAGKILNELDKVIAGEPQLRTAVEKTQYASPANAVPVETPAPGTSGPTRRPTISRGPGKTVLKKRKPTMIPEVVPDAPASVVTMAAAVNAVPESPQLATFTRPGTKDPLSPSEIPDANLADYITEAQARLNEAQKTRPPEEVAVIANDLNKLNAEQARRQAQPVPTEPVSLGEQPAKPTPEELQEAILQSLPDDVRAELIANPDKGKWVYTRPQYNYEAAGVNVPITRPVNTPDGTRLATTLNGVEIQPWQMTLAQYGLNYKEYITFRHGWKNLGQGEFAFKPDHARFVETALKEGKPVPPEVLVDYPDLAAKYGKQEPAPVANQPARIAPAQGQEVIGQKGRTAVNAPKVAETALAVKYRLRFVNPKVKTGKSEVFVDVWVPKSMIDENGHVDSAFWEKKSEEAVVAFKKKIKYSSGYSDWRYDSANDRPAHITQAQSDAVSAGLRMVADVQNKLQAVRRGIAKNGEEASARAMREILQDAVDNGGYSNSQIKNDVDFYNELAQANGYELVDTKRNAPAEPAPVAPETPVAAPEPVTPIPTPETPVTPPTPIVEPVTVPETPGKPIDPTGAPQLVTTKQGELLQGVAKEPAKTPSRRRATAEEKSDVVQTGKRGEPGVTAGSNLGQKDVLQSVGLEPLEEGARGKKASQEDIANAFTEKTLEAAVERINKQVADGTSIDRLSDAEIQNLAVQSRRVADTMDDLNRKLAKVGNDLKRKQVYQDDFDAAREKLIAYTKAARATGSATARALAARNAALLDDYSTVGLYNRLSRATDGNITPEVTARVKDAETQAGSKDSQGKSMGDIQDEIAAIEKKNTRKRAEGEFNEVAKGVQAKGRRVSTKEQRAAVTERLKSTAREAMAAAQKALRSAPIGSSPLQAFSDVAVAVAPYVKQMVKDAVELGAVSFKGAAETVRENLREAGIDITEDQVAEVLDGVHDDPTSKTPRAQTPLAAVKKEGQDRARGSVEGRRRSLRQRIENVGKPKKPRTERPKFEDDPKVRRLNIELETKKLAVDRELAKIEQERVWREMTPAQRNWERLFYTPLNVARTVRASFDFGAAANQGWFYSLSHPLKSAKYLGESIVRGWTRKGTDKVLADVRQDPYFEKARAGKLGIDAVYGDRVDDYLNVSEKITEFGGAFNPLGVSQRAMDIYLARIRMDMFKEYAKSLEKGKTLTLKDYKEIAEVVNTLTGTNRYNLGQGGKIASATLFAPKYMISRIETGLMTPVLKNINRNPKLALKAAGDYLKGSVSLLALKFAADALLAYNNPDKTKEPPKTDTDPRSSKFMTATANNIEAKLPGNLLQVYQVMRQMTEKQINAGTGVLYQNGKKLNTTMKIGRDGKPTPTEKYNDFTAKDAMGAITNFIGGKVSPGLAIGLGLLDGERFGKPFNLDTNEGRINVMMSFAPILGENGRDIVLDKRLSDEQKALTIFNAVFNFPVQPTFDKEKYAKPKPPPKL
jgi:hypothetical protein